MTLEEKLALVTPQAEKMPGVVVVLRFPEYSPVYMSSNGLQLLGLSLSDLLQTGDQYTLKFFNRDFMDDFKEELRRMLEKDEKANETLTFFHQVKYHEGQEFVWFTSSVKIFHRDKQNSPSHIIAISVPIGDLKGVSEKAERLLDQNLFSRKYREKFETLSPRAKEILKLVALGKSSVEIAGDLNISADTVNSHRRLLKDKLDATSNYDLLRYALSFDLI